MYSIWNIVYHPDVALTLQRYIDMYVGYFLDIYSDTGLWGEDTIRANCIERSRSLYGNLRDAIADTLTRDIVPYAPIGSDRRSTVAMVGRRMIAIEYREDTTSHTRYVESIRIWRR